MSKYDLCMGCMSPLGGDTKCRKCGYVAGTAPQPGALTPGTMLAGRFVAGAVQSANGEGVTYIGMDTENKRKVEITEFFPRNLSRRKDRSDVIEPDAGCEGMYSDYLSDFLEVHRAVARLSDMPAIVPLIDLFECNGTAYAVYKHVQGKPFSELVKRAGRLTWDEARPLFIPLISALSSAQKLGLVHFAIDPENLIFAVDGGSQSDGGKLMLKGFGIPDARLAETDLKAGLSDGFSAFEQYSADGEKGKWTDVYSVAAVMLYALTGKKLPDAISRSYESRLNIPSSLAGEIPTHVVSALAKALQVNPADRTQSMERFFDDLVSKQRDSVRSEQPRQRQQAQRPAPVRERVPEKRPAVSGPWYKNLTQFQYWLLTTCLAVLVLGTIGVLVFFKVAPKLSDDRPASTVTYKDDTTASSTVSNTETLFAVPDLVGMDWGEVLMGGEYAGRIELYETDPKYSDDYDVGIIMEQGTKPNTMVRLGTPVWVTVSLGSKKCKVPNIVDMTVSEADDALTRAGLRLGTQTEEYNDSIQAGRIISLVDVSVGDSIDRDSTVNVKVSLGHEG